MRRSDVLSTWSGRVAAAVVVLALLAAGAVAASYTPLFRIRSIDVVGVRHLSERRVLRIAGIERDANLAHLDLIAAEHALERDPHIADATVSRRLPSALSITVVERSAIAGALTADGRAAVASDGTVIPDVNPAGLPEIRAAIGELSPEGESAALEALIALPTTFRAALTALVVQPDGTLVVEIADGPTVEYGAATDTVAKADAIRAVMSWAAEHGVDLGSIDVTAPSAPTARTRDGSPVSL